MYPQTPPIYGWLFIVLYIFTKATESGRKPTSNNIVNLGDIFSLLLLLNYLQNPLKNQLCDDNFCAFLYFITKKIFILIA